MKRVGPENYRYISSFAVISRKRFNFSFRCFDHRGYLSWINCYNAFLSYMLCNQKLRNQIEYTEGGNRHVDNMWMENLLRCFTWHARHWNQYYYLVWFSYYAWILVLSFIVRVAYGVYAFSCIWSTVSILSNWQCLFFPSEISYGALLLLKMTQVYLRRNSEGRIDADGKVWAAPYRWGCMVIAYKKSKFRKHKLAPVEVNMSPNCLLSTNSF